MSLSSLEGTRRRALAFLAVCATTALLVFILPFWIPATFFPTISASYVAGFNNRVASLATAAIGCTVLFAFFRLTSRKHPTTPSAHDTPLTSPWIGGTILVSAIISALFCWAGAQSGLSYMSDAGYFIHQLEAHSNYGRSLYTQLEFAYGPLLFYPTLLLQKMLHGSMHSAYFVTLILMQSIGLWFLAWILNELPIRTTLRKLALVLLAAGALTPLLGQNYTFFRFVTPMAFLLFSIKRTTLWGTTLSLALSEIVLLGISPELGFALLPGALAFATLSIWQRGWRWLTILVGPAAGAYIFLLFAGRPYLQMIASFGRGSLNLPIEPLPHILIFLFATVWLVPAHLGTALTRTDTRQARLVACYALSLGLLPAAFGRCDPLHVFFNGTGVMLLSLVVISQAARPARIAWTMCFAIWIIWAQGVNFRLYADRTAETVRIAILRDAPSEPEDRLDLAALEHEVGTDTIATPLAIGLAAEQQLRQSHHDRGEFYCFFADVFSPANLDRKIDELNQAHWALIPVDPDYPFIETPGNIDEVQGFALPYRSRNPIPFDPGTLFDKNLDEQWTEVRPFGPYMLYRKK